MIAVLLAVSLALDPSPVAGSETVLTLTGDDDRPVVGATLSVVQRHGLPGQREVGAGITDSLGRVRWTPQVPGPATLYVGQTPAAALHVAWASPPPSALVPLVLLVLAGAAAALHGASLLPRRRG